MAQFRIFQWLIQKFSQFPLWMILTIPFLLEVGGAVALVGYISYVNGQQTVKDLANQIIQKTDYRIEDQITHFLQLPEQILQDHQSLASTGILNLNDIDAWLPYLWQKYDTTSHITYIVVANEAGEYRVIGKGRRFPNTPLVKGVGVAGERTNGNLYIYDTIEQALKPDSPAVNIGKFDPRLRPWYQKAMTAKQASWTEIYSEFATPNLLIALTTPIASPNNPENLIGVTSTIINLTFINEFLESLDISEIGQAFILDSSGNLVATSTGEKPFRIKDNSLERLAATESQNFLTRSLANYLKGESNDFSNLEIREFQELTLQKEDYYLSVIPLRDDLGLEWQLVVSVPQSAFLGKIQENTRITIILCLLTLGVASSIGFLTAHWVTHPILKLNQAAKEITRGNWNSTVENFRTDELGELTESFNQMAVQLQQFFQSFSESERKLMTFLETVPVGISIIDTTGEIVLLNKMAEEILGQGVVDVPIEEMSEVYGIYRAGTNSLYSPEQLPIFHALQGQKVINDDIEIHRPDGKIIPLENYATPVVDDTGKVLYGINAFIDITERKQAEELRENYESTLKNQVEQRTQELEESQKSLAESQKIAQVGNWCCDRLTGKITWSEETFRIYGFDPQQPEPSYEELLARIHPDDLDLFLHNVQLAFSEGRNYEHEIRILLPDGSLRYTWQKGQAIHNQLGQVIQLFGTVQNISDRKQIELELQRTNQYLHSLVQNSLLGTIVWDAKFHIQLWSKQAENIFGWTEAEVLGKHFSDFELVYAEDSDLVKEQVRKVVLNQDYHPVLRNRNYRKDGSVIECEWYNSPIYDQSGKFINLLCLVQDVTEQRQREIALEEAKKAAILANQAKSEFVANMSHEIRTPMNAILGFSELLRDTVQNPKEQSYVKSILASGRILLDLINDILDLSKIEAGKLNINYASVNLRAIMEEMQAIFAEQVEKKQLDLQVEIEDLVPNSIQFDEVRLRQILFNVVSNAIKFTEQGYIKISLKSSPVQNQTIDLEIAIEDTGIGIPPEQKVAIFDPFTQVKGQSVAKYGGTGLGLAIVQRLTQLLGGNFRLDSEVGVGSTFIFTFPNLSCLHEETTETPQEEGVKNLNQFKPAKILVVDDVPSNLELIKSYFAETQHRLFLALDGVEAVEIARQEDPDLILLDLQMPKMSGEEVIEILKNDAKTQDIPIIISTAVGLVQQRENIQSLAQGYIYKPVNSSALVAELRKFLPIYEQDLFETVDVETIEPQSNSVTYLSSKGIELLPDLLVKLNQEAENWQHIYQSMTIRKIKNFASHLQELAREYDNAILLDYANTLWTQIESLDLDNLPTTLQSFPSLMQELKEFNLTGFERE